MSSQLIFMWSSHCSCVVSILGMMWWQVQCIFKPYWGLGGTYQPKFKFSLHSSLCLTVIKGHTSFCTCLTLFLFCYNVGCPLQDIFHQFMTVFEPWTGTLLCTTDHLKHQHCFHCWFSQLLAKYDCSYFKPLPHFVMFYALCSARTYIPPSLMTSEQSHYLCVLDVYVMMCTSMPQHTCHNVTVFASIPQCIWNCHV